MAAVVVFAGAFCSATQARRNRRIDHVIEEVRGTEGSHDSAAR